MKRACIPILLVLLSAIAPSITAEMVLSGTANIQAGIFFDKDDLLESTFDQQMTASPVLSAWTDAFEFSFQGSISAQNPPASLDFNIDELRITLYPFDFMQIRAGRFSYLPGTAEFLSSTNYFSRTDYEKLITGTVDETSVPNDLLQLGIFVSNYYFKFTVAPFRAEMLLPDVTSPWFPGKDIPTSLLIPELFTTTTYHLDEVLYRTPEPAGYSLDEVSFSPEIGATFGGVDVSLMYYRGFDNTPLTKAYFTDMDSYEKTYRIELLPYYRWIDAIGANVATAISSLRLWADASYTFEKAILSNRVSFVSRNTPVVVYPYLEYTFGASYEIYDPSIFFLFEIRNSHIIGGGDYLVEPLLGSTFTTGLNLSFFDSRLATNFFTLFSFVDQSMAFVTRLSYDPTDDLTASLTFPLFAGNADTELGQFASNKYLSANLQWRY